MNWSAIISLIWCNIFQIVVYWITFECIELHLVGKWSAWRAKPISPCLSVQKSICPYQGCEFFIFKVLGQKLDLHFLIQVVWIKNWKLKILFFGMNEHEKKLILKQILYMLIKSTVETNIVIQEYSKLKPPAMRGITFYVLIWYMLRLKALILSLSFFI